MRIASELFRPATPSLSSAQIVSLRSGVQHHVLCLLRCNILTRPVVAFFIYQLWGSILLSFAWVQHLSACYVAVAVICECWGSLIGLLTLLHLFSLAVETSLALVISGSIVLCHLSHW